MADDRVLRTSAGEFPLNEYRLGAGGRAWSILHVGSVMSYAEESRSLKELFDKLPYGVALWPASIALAHEIASRPEAFACKSVLELGAGTGLPGIVAATLGARVVQTDRNELAMSLCRRNGERNAATGIERRLVEWAEWTDATRYDVVLGSDVLYGPEAHPLLRNVFEASLAPGGRVLLSDPFRADSLSLLESMEADGWRVGLTKWTVGEEASPRPIAVYELVSPPR